MTQNNSTVNFAENIYNLRVNNKYTQHQVGEAMGVSHQTIANYEQGKTSPAIKMVQMFAELYGVEMYDLTLAGKFPLIGPEPMKGKQYGKTLTVSEKKLIRAIRTKNFVLATRLLAKAMNDAE